MATYQDHRIGKTIYADDIKLLRRKHRQTPSASLWNVNLNLIHKDYSSLVSRVNVIDSDNLVTPQEKQTLQREWDQLNALRSTTLVKSSEFGIETSDEYVNASNAYAVLDSIMDVVLDPLHMDEEIDISALPDMSTAFSNYFDKAKILDEKLFRYETGMIGGLDYRTKYKLNVIGNTTIALDGTPTTLRINVLDDNVDITEQFDPSCFLWYRMTDESSLDSIWNDNHATPSKTLTITIDDLVYGHATFLCKMTYYYSETMYIESSGILSVSKEIPGPPGEDAYQIQVISLNGTTFRVEKEFSTTLQVRVWQGGEEITDLFTDADFRWRRVSTDAHADNVWNSAHYSTGGKTITITQEDVLGRSNFFCDLLNQRS